MRAIRSVLRHSDRQVEIIVVDDGSEMDLSRTYRVLGEYGVRVLRMPNRRSGSYARNVAAREATGDYVSFLDSDDVWLPGHCDRIKALFRSSRAASCSPA